MTSLTCLLISHVLAPLLEGGGAGLHQTVAMHFKIRGKKPLDYILYSQLLFQFVSNVGFLLAMVLLHLQQN